jgi:hypothetical protein
VRGDIENRLSNRDSNTVLTGTVETDIGWTGTRNRDAVTNRDDVLVVLRVGVAVVPHQNSVGNERELERFVLGALSDATRECESSQWVSC